MNSQKPTALGRSPQSGKLLRSLLLNVLTNAFLYVGQLLIARGLSREDYGTFTVVVSFVSLMALFADLGLTLLFVRKFAEASERTQLGDKEERGELLGSMLVLRIGLAVVVSGLVVTIAPLLGYPAETRHLMAIMLLTLFLSSRLMVVRSVGEAFLRGHNRFHMVAMFASIDAAVFAIGVWWMQHHHLTLEGAVWVYSLCHIPGFLLLTGFIASHAKETGFRL